MPQSLAHLALHIVFSTKDRKAWIEPSSFREELHAFLGGVLRGHQCPPLAVGGTGDHVHFLCLLSRTMTVADLVRVVKRAVTVWARQHGKEYAGFQWQNGYGTFSVSASNEDHVRAYIVRQEAHHEKMDYKAELRELLARHGVAYDEQYVWD